MIKFFLNSTCCLSLGEKEENTLSLYLPWALSHSFAENYLQLIQYYIYVSLLDLFCSQLNSI